MTCRSLTIAALSALTMVAATAAPADAGSRRHGFHGLHFGHGYYGHVPRIRINIGGHRGCGFYYSKWKRTGSWYWRDQFYDCRYGY